MLSVSRLGAKFGLSRSTILYYEREGLLQPASRSDNGYRWYGDKEINRLERICAYRSYGVPVREIQDLLEKESSLAVEQALRKRFSQLDADIKALRQQQRAIVGILEHGTLQDGSSMSKERWTAIMRAAGMSEQDMSEWHRQFEAREPEAHREFLESLNLGEEEIRLIRQFSQSRPA